MAAQGLSMQVGSKPANSCQLCHCVWPRLETTPSPDIAHLAALAAQLPSFPAAQLLYTTELTHAAQAMISLATASELLAVAHSRSGETLEYLQSMYRVRWVPARQAVLRPSGQPMTSCGSESWAGKAV